MTAGLGTTTIFTDLTPSQLVEKGLDKNEGRLTDNGAFLVTTGKRTGRSPADRFIIKEPNTEESIDWGPVNRPFDAGKFDTLWERVSAHIASKDSYIAHLHVGQHSEHYLPVKVTTETAWQTFLVVICLSGPSNITPRPRANGTFSTRHLLSVIPSEMAQTLMASLLLILLREKFY
jgi:ATP-dependent phosphoenolpyruvate carboxykinase